MLVNLRGDATADSVLAHRDSVLAVRDRTLIARYLCVGQAIPRAIVQQDLRRTAQIVQPIGPTGVFWARFGDRCWAAELLDAERSRTVSLRLASPGINESIILRGPQYELELSYRHRFVATDVHEDELQRNSLREFQLPSDEKPLEDSPWIRCAVSGYHRYQTFATQRQCEAARGSSAGDSAPATGIVDDRSGSAR